MSIYAWMMYAVVGVFAGFLAGLLGIGGGLVTVPFLLLTFHLSGFPETYGMHVAIGTSLAAMVFTAFASAWSHYQNQGIIWGVFRALSPGIIAGAVIGAVIADDLPSKQLQLFFGCSICLIGIYFLLRNNRKPLEGDFKGPHPLCLVISGVVIGVISSILGIGGGILTVPLLTAFRLPIRNAISTSAATGFLIALFGALSFLCLGLRHRAFGGTIGFVYIPGFIIIGLVSTLFAPLGAKMAYTLPTKILSQVFGIYLMIVGILMIYPT